MDPNDAQSVKSLRLRIQYAQALIVLGRQDIPVEVLLTFEQEIDEYWDTISELEDKKKEQRGGCKDPRKEAMLEVMGRNSRITGFSIADLIDIHFSLYPVLQSPELASKVEAEVRSILEAALDAIIPERSGLSLQQEEMIGEIISDIETTHYGDLPEEDSLRYDALNLGERVTFWLGRLEPRDPLRTQLHDLYYR